MALKSRKGPVTKGKKFGSREFGESGCKQSVKNRAKRSLRKGRVCAVRGLGVEFIGGGRKLLGT